MLQIGPWVFHAESPDTMPGGEWRAPAGARHVVDLSPRGQIGLGVWDAPTSLGSDYTQLGDPQAPIARARRNTVASRLSVAGYDETTVGGMLFEHFTRWGDTGSGLTVPMLGVGRGGVVRLHLGNGNLVERRFLPGDAGWDVLQEGVREQYRRVRQQALDGTIPEDHHRKWLGHRLTIYGLTSRDRRALVPEDLPDETPMRPSTVVQEPFSGSSLANMTVREGSGYAESGGAFGYTASGAIVEHDTALSSDGHSSQIKDTGSASGRRFGPVYRSGGTATVDLYMWLRFGTVFRWYKRVDGGSYEVISETGTPGSSGLVLRAEVTEADEHTLKEDGVAIIGPTSDSSIQGHFHGGIGCGFGTESGTGDDLELDDGLGGGGGGSLLKLVACDMENMRDMGGMRG